MLLELVDRILDKGIVIDAWARVSLLSIEILTVEARIVVASVDTYLRYAEAIGNTALASMPHPQTVQQARPALVQGQQQGQQPAQVGGQQAGGQQMQGLPQPQQQNLMPPRQGLQQPAQQPQPQQAQPQQAQQPPPPPQQPQQQQQPSH